MANNLDEYAKVGLEFLVTTVKLNTQILASIMNFFLEDKKRSPSKTDFEKKHYKDLIKKEKSGNQDIKDLTNKHKGNVMAFDSNFTKDEAEMIKKHFNYFGVDFSIQKVGENRYSILFSGESIELIEKAMKNVAEELSLNNEKKKNPKFSVDDLKEKVHEFKEKNKDKAKEKNKDKDNTKEKTHDFNNKKERTR